MDVQKQVAMNEDGGKYVLPLPQLKKYVPILTAGIISGLMNRAVLPGGYFPMGAGFMAAVPQQYAAAAAVGGVLSCLTDGGMLYSLEGLRHVASLLAVAGIRWALGELKRVNRAKFYPFFAAAAGILMTGTVIHSTTGSLISYSTLYFIIEGAMAGLAAMFFSAACKAYERFGSGQRLSRMASVSLIITVCAAAIPLCRIRLLGLSPGIILLHTAVLQTAYERRESGGAAAGIAGGCVTSLARYSMLQGAVTPVAALLAGYASFYGRIFAASAYTACCFIGSLTSGAPDFVFAAEAAAGAVISCLIPKEYAGRALAAAGFVPRGSCRAQAGDEAAEKLSGASDALAGLCDVLGQVTDGLDKRSLPGDDSIYTRAVDEVCGKCEFCGNCFTKDSVRVFAEKLKKGRSVSGSEISRSLGKKCVREDELAGAINRGYGYYLASRSAHSRISFLRSVFSGQLEGVGMMLESMSNELNSCAAEDEYSAGMVSRHLTACGYESVSCSCRSGESGKTRLFLTVRSRDDESDAEDIAACAGECLDCDFEVERAENDGDMIYIVLAQRKRFALQCVSAQHCCGGGSLCGDSCEWFEDSGSRGYMILSDGMGSGGRAAVEGALTCELFRRLLSGGFGFDSAVRIVNSALMIKSEDETLSTADCLEVNLYSGRAVVSKAGAAQSYHVRNGMVTRVDLPSLPLGILCDTDTARYSFTAEEGDMIVMISDGVPTDGSTWLEDMLRKWDGSSSEELAHKLLGMAEKHRPEGEDDDITVMIGTIEKIPRQSQPEKQLSRGE